VVRDVRLIKKLGVLSKGYLLLFHKEMLQPEAFQHVKALVMAIHDSY